MPITATAASASTTGLVQPSCIPKIRTIIMASTATMKFISPMTSKGWAFPPATRLSGVPRMSSIATRQTTVEMRKIQIHPRVLAIVPPKTAAEPAPPKEPIDHIETARCRAGPSQ